MSLHRRLTPARLCLFAHIRLATCPTWHRLGRGAAAGPRSFLSRCPRSLRITLLALLSDDRLFTRRNPSFYGIVGLLMTLFAYFEYDQRFSLHRLESLVAMSISQQDRSCHPKSAVVISPPLTDQPDVSTVHFKVFFFSPKVPP